MKIIVFGATGGTGRQVVKRALARGHAVTAVVRRADHDLAQHELLKVVIVNAADREQIAPHIRGHDAVVSALGTDQKGVVNVCTDWTVAVLAAMRTENLKRLIAVSAFGASETRSKLSLYSLLLWWALPDKMRDKEAMEAVISASDRDWTIIRPPALSNSRADGRYRAGLDLPIHLWSRITRADLADFILDQLEGDQFVRQCPRIAA